MVTIQEAENEANVYDWQLNFIQKKGKLTLNGKKITTTKCLKTFLG